jgi:hypothetical protein
MGEWRYSFTILKIGTRWRWQVVSFTTLPLYTPEKEPPVTTGLYPDSCVR